LPVDQRNPLKLRGRFVGQSGSPVRTRFELLRANWYCDRTRQRLTFSE
jgi:hypothetical protein